MANHEVIAQLFERHYHEIYRYIKYRVGDPLLADDLTATTYLCALTAKFTYTSDRKARAFLRKIANARFIDHLRSAAYKRASLSSVDALANLLRTPSFEQESDGRLQIAKLEKAISQLTLMQQQVVNLRYFQQEPIPIKEIALKLNTSPPIIKSRLHRAKRSLRRLLKDEE
ncbi:hypothetical protein A2899_01055 [Candidatus Amesbacteria bacterium RIFCSPLOWO2_01_FULL_49_25]|uniref:RNA polymerase sigma factor 70 region 4 type 2 domain-containing protein n=1 Tax=Candidatus Amesbacteria bacterium RIFCSPHIGHO2_01_FULL_48_32b TaxID=1797253 RepID=A0A1F4YFX4_9BACT|nr:MAG: hypothetical protein A2876_02110 [Candidatus Amesbacteria bacterium RIFCSPHIGHO2_01_FULL_48_32b]OGD07151.1 MAG: hypothetical protein A2899_01055 [Candidatus Amesbacteria bacterium RIFCSPLOWO2_01_FULL_49_25]